MYRERVKWIDYAKGIVLFLVIIGHCITLGMRNNSLIAKQVYDTIYFFHMPLMFYISGRTFALSMDNYRTKKISEYIVTRFKGYIIPYLSYVTTVKILFVLILIMPMTSKIMANTTFSSDKSFLIGLITANNAFSLHVWYLYVLFLMVVVSFCGFRLVNRYFNYAVVLTILAIIMYMFRPSWMLERWFGMFMFLGMYIWFCLGIIIDISKIRRTIALGLIFSSIVLYYINVGDGVPGKIKHLFLIFGIIVFFIRLCMLFEKRCLLDSVRMFGKKSMVYYLFHQPFFAVIPSTILYKIMPNMWFMPVMCGLFTSILGVCIIMKIIEKYDLKFIKRVYLGKYKTCK